MKKNILIVAILLFVTIVNAQPKQGVTFRVHLEAALITDTLELSLWQTLYGIIKQERQEPDHYVQAVMQNGVFELKIPEVKGTGYLQLSLANVERKLDLGRPLQLLLNYTYEPGDSITVYFDSLGVRGVNNLTGVIRKDVIRSSRFAGKGVSKYILQQQLDSLPQKYQHEIFVSGGSKRTTFLSDLVTRMNKQNRLPDEIASIQEKMIQSASIDEEVRSRLIMDVRAKAFYSQTKVFWSKYNLSKGNTRDTLAGYYDTSHYYKWRIPANDSKLPLSVYITDYVCLKAQVDSRMGKNQPTAYEAIKGMFTGRNCEHFITAYLFNYFERVDSTDRFLKDAYGFVKSTRYRRTLDEFSSRLSKGSPAFAFRLVDQKGAVRTLEDFKGKVVLMDFWYTGCGGCSKYYTGVLSRIEHELRNDTDVVFLPVSIDDNPAEWKNSIKRGLYTGKDDVNLVNLYTGGKGDNDAVIRNYKVTEYPRPILIDKQGKIAESNNTKLRTYDALLQSIQAAKQ